MTLTDRPTANPAMLLTLACRENSVMLNSVIRTNAGKRLNVRIVGPSGRWCWGRGSAAAF